VVERTRRYTLYAKTGSSGATKNSVWWWVGWIERNGRTTAVFAMNLAPSSTSRREDRVVIGRALLREAGVLPFVS